MKLPPELIIEDWYQRRKSGQDAPVTGKEREALVEMVNRKLEHNRQMTSYDQFETATNNYLNYYTQSESTLGKFTGFMKGAYALTLAKYFEPQRHKMATLAMACIKDIEKRREAGETLA